MFSRACWHGLQTQNETERYGTVVRRSCLVLRYSVLEPGGTGTGTGTAVESQRSRLFAKSMRVFASRTLPVTETFTSYGNSKELCKANYALAYTELSY